MGRNENGEYSISQIKMFAYNNQPPEDLTWTENNLYCGLAYCYEWFRSHPEDKVECEKLMDNYINWYEVMKPIEGR